eukprot:tig00020554_g10883.t2
MIFGFSILLQASDSLGARSGSQAYIGSALQPLTHSSACSQNSKRGESGAMKLKLSVALTVPLACLVLSTSVAIWASSFVMSSNMIDDILEVEQAGLISRISDAIEGRLMRTARSVHMLVATDVAENHIPDLKDFLGGVRQHLWRRLTDYLGVVRSKSLSGVRVAFPNGQFVGYISGISGGTTEWSLVIKAQPGISDLLFYDVDAAGAPAGRPYRNQSRIDSKRLVWWAACQELAPADRATAWADEYSAVGGLLAVIACANVYDSKGDFAAYVATHYFTKELTAALESLSFGALDTTSFIVERKTGVLIASSRGAVTAGSRRLKPSDPEVDPVIRAMSQRLLNAYGSLDAVPTSARTIDASGGVGSGYIVQAFDVTSLPDGPSWLVCSAIARSSFTPNAVKTALVTGAIAIAATLVGVAGAFGLAHLVSRPSSTSPPPRRPQMEGLAAPSAVEGHAAAAGAGGADELSPLEAAASRPASARSSRAPASSKKPPSRLGRAWAALRRRLAGLKLVELLEIENIFYEFIVRGLAAHYAEARALLRMRNNFIRNMSHEIRTPLNGIVGCASLLRETGLSPDQTELAELISKASGTLVDVISDILDWERIKSGRMILCDEDFDLREMVEDSADLVVIGANARGVDVITRWGPGLPRRVCADSLRLRQVLLNLLSNAVKFSKPGGTVTLRVSLAGPNADYRPRHRSQSALVEEVMGADVAAEPPALAPAPTAAPAPSPPAQAASGRRRRHRPSRASRAPSPSPAGRAPAPRPFPPRRGLIMSAARVSPPPPPAGPGGKGGGGAGQEETLERSLAPPEAVELAGARRAGGGSALLVAGAPEGDGLHRIEFAVSDEGIGVAPEQQAAIFQPFVQADATITRKYGGTGLGLALSSTIVQEMGGRINVESALGEGSTFLFAVPLKPARGRGRGRGPGPRPRPAPLRRRRPPVVAEAVTAWAQRELEAGAGAGAGPGGAPATLLAFADASAASIAGLGGAGELPISRPAATAAGRQIVVPLAIVAQARPAPLPPLPRLNCRWQRGQRRPSVAGTASRASSPLEPACAAPSPAPRPRALSARRSQLAEHVAAEAARAGAGPALMMTPQASPTPRPASTPPPLSLQRPFHLAELQRLVSRMLELAAGAPREEGERGQRLAASSSVARRAGGRPAALPSASPSPGPAPPRTLAEANVLCAEDNPFNRLVLGKLLARIGCRFAMAEDGQQAIDALLRSQPGPNAGAAAVWDAGAGPPEPFHLVLMDIQMPVLDGLGATREIRRLEAAGELAPGPVPIVGVSANCTAEDRDAASKAGMQLFCSKPVKMESLVRRMRECLGMPPEAGAPPPEAA